MDSETEQRLRLLSRSEWSSFATSSTPVLQVDDNENPIPVPSSNNNYNNNNLKYDDDLTWLEDRPNVTLSSSPTWYPLRNTTSPFSSRFNLHDEISPQSSPTTTSITTTTNHSLVAMSRQMWEITGHWIHTLQNEIEELENDGILGHAIIRGCQEMADTIAHITTELRQHQQQQQQQQYGDDGTTGSNIISQTVPSHLDRDDDINSKNNQLFEHSVNSLLLQIEGLNTDIDVSVSDHDRSSAVYDIVDFPIDYDITTNDESEGIANIDPLPPVIDLLNDIEHALRSIDADEANDLADAAITVGHLLVAALQQLHSQLPVSSTIMNPTHRRGIQQQQQLEESPNIIRLNDDDEDENDTATATATELTDRRNTTTPKTGPAVPPYKPYTPKRVRCIWPPLQPVAENILQYTQQEVLQKQPMYITAPIFLTCWPIIATSTVLVGGMVVTDMIAQQIYHHIQDHPIVVTSEVSMASVVQTMKLGYLTSKAVAKPTVRVLQKQIQRHAPQVQESIVYHIHHPIETIHSTIQNLDWCRQQVLHWVGHAIQEWSPSLPQPHTNDDTDSVNSSYVPMVDSDTTMLQRMSL